MRAAIEPLVDDAFAAFADAVARMPHRVVGKSLPVLFFGDLDAYAASSRRIITAALNPSGREFPATAPRSRFPSAKLLDPSADLTASSRTDYLNALCQYFEKHPLKDWRGLRAAAARARGELLRRR